MTGLRKVLIVSALLFFYSMNGFGTDIATTQESRGNRQGPPAEAYTACEGKVAGDTAEFTNPRGDTVSGTCEQEGDRLVVRPDRSMGHSGGKHQGPPPQAYTACADKKAGDVVQFTSPRGDTISGTCEQEGDRLILRPDHSPNK